MKKLLALAMCCGITALAVAATSTSGIGVVRKVSTATKGGPVVKAPNTPASPQLGTMAKAPVEHPQNAREAQALYSQLKQRGQEIPAWLSAMAFPAQPAGDPARQGGDLASSATVIPSLPYSDSGTTVGYGSEVGNAAPDVFYSLTLGATDVVTVSLCATAVSWDSYLRIYRNVGGTVGTQVASNDDSCGLLSQITSQTLSAGSYFIVVEGYSANSGAYTLNVSGSGVDPCQAFNAATTAITLPYTGTGSNVGAPNVTGSGAGDVGYTFTLTEASSLTLTSCMAGTTFDSDSYVFAGNPCSGGTQLLYNDGNSACSFASWATAWTQDCGVFGAGTYTLVMTGYATSAGSYAFSLSASSCACPPIVCTGTPEAEPNDGPNGAGDFGAIACGETVCGTTFTVGDSTRDTDWYEVLLLSDGILSVNLDCGSFDGLLFVLGSDASTVLASADNAPFCQDETLATECLPAGTYYVWVGPNGFTGLDTPVNYGVTVSCQACTYVSPCQNLTPLTCGSTLAGTAPTAHNFGDATTTCTGYTHNGFDRAYELVVTAPAVYTITMLSDNASDEALVLYSVCGTEASCLAGADATVGTGETISLSLTPGTYYVVADFYGTGETDSFTLGVTCTTCQPIICTGDPEVEPNGSPTEFNSLICGQTFCGSTYTVGDTLRDTDWFEVVLTSDAILTATLDVENFDGQILLLNADGTLVLASADAAGYCQDETLVTSCLQAGSYFVFVSHNAFSGVDTPANYGLALSCQACTWVDPYSGCQAVAGISDAWTAATSDVEAGYARADHFGQVVGGISAVDFRGLPLFNNGTAWSVCAEDPMTFAITFYDLAMVQTATYNATLTGVAGDTYAGTYPSMDYHFDLPAPLFQADGHVSIVGTGGATCWFLWMSSASGADATSLLNDGTGWANDTFDLNYCFTTVQPCDPVVDLAVTMLAGDAHLSWTATAGATSYAIYGSVDGYGTYAPLGTSATPSFTDLGAQSSGRKFYRVVTVCQ